MENMVIAFIKGKKMKFKNNIDAALAALGGLEPTSLAERWAVTEMSKAIHLGDMDRAYTVADVAFNSIDQDLARAGFFGALDYCLGLANPFQEEFVWKPE